MQPLLRNAKVANPGPGLYMNQDLLFERCFNVHCCVTFTPHLNWIHPFLFTVAVPQGNNIVVDDFLYSLHLTVYQCIICRKEELGVHRLFSVLLSTAFDSSLLSNIQKLFSERIEIFSSVEFSKVSVLTGIVKIGLKVCWRSQGYFNRPKFRQVNVGKLTHIIPLVFVNTHVSTNFQISRS